AAVTKATGYDTAELTTAIEDALESVWSWQTSGFGADVEPIDVQTVIESVPGVDSVTSLTLPSTTAAVAFDEFAVIGTVALTITGEAVRCRTYTTSTRSTTSTCPTTGGRCTTPALRPGSPGRDSACSTCCPNMSATPIRTASCC